MLFVTDTDSNSGLPEELKQIDDFNADIAEAGQLVMAAGLGPSAKGKFIETTGGISRVEPGSLNGEVFYSGFWIIEVESFEQAIEIGKAASRACGRRLELRPFL